LFLYEKRLLAESTSSSAMAERPRNACVESAILKAVRHFGAKF